MVCLLLVGGWASAVSWLSAQSATLVVAVPVSAPVRVSELVARGEIVLGGWKAPPSAAACTKNREALQPIVDRGLPLHFDALGGIVFLDAPLVVPKNVVPRITGTGGSVLYDGLAGCCALANVNPDGDVLVLGGKFDEPWGGIAYQGHVRDMVFASMHADGKPHGRGLVVHAGCNALVDGVSCWGFSVGIDVVSVRAMENCAVSRVFTRGCDVGIRAAGAVPPTADKPRPDYSSCTLAIRQHTDIASRLPLVVERFGGLVLVEQCVYQSGDPGPAVTIRDSQVELRHVYWENSAASAVSLKIEGACRRVSLEHACFAAGGRERLVIDPKSDFRGRYVEIGGVDYDEIRLGRNAPRGVWRPSGVPLGN